MRSGEIFFLKIEKEKARMLARLNAINNYDGYNDDRGKGKYAILG